MSNFLSPPCSSEAYYPVFFNALFLLQSREMVVCASAEHSIVEDGLSPRVFPALEPDIEFSMVYEVWAGAAHVPPWEVHVWHEPRAWANRPRIPYWASVRPHVHPQHIHILYSVSTAPHPKVYNIYTTALHEMHLRIDLATGFEGIVGEGGFVVAGHSLNTSAPESADGCALAGDLVTVGIPTIPYDTDTRWRTH